MAHSADSQTFPVVRRKRKLESSPDFSRTTLRIVLLGKSVSENSRVGNFLLGRAAFDSEAPPDVVERVGGRLKDRHVMVINSPQLLQTHLSLRHITQTVRECVYLSDPGPHAFILVLQCEDFTEEDMRRVNYIMKEFSEEAIKRTIVLTTDEETHEAQGAPVKLNEFIQQLTAECGGGHLQLDNEKERFCSGISQRLEKIFRENHDDYIICELYDDAEETPVDEEQSRSVGSVRAVEKKDSHVHDDDGKHKGTHTTIKEEKGVICSVVDNDDDLRIVLLGKTGVGKSATGNTILRIKAFKSILTSRSVTRECQKETSEFNRRHITVIDTPGLFDTGVDNVETRKEIVKCVSMGAPGPHVFLLVIQLGRFTQEEKDAVKMIQETFGEKSRMYTIVLFTRGDELGETTIQDFIEDNESVKNLVQQFGQRYHVFNNNETKDQTQVSELLDKIDCMLAVNRGSFYDNEMFQLVEKNIKEEQERIMKEKEEESKRKEEELRAKYAAEMDQMKKERERERQEMQNELRKREDEFKNREEEIKKETDENLRKELQRKLKEKQKEFEMENKRKEKALEEEQQNFIKYLEENHEKEKQKLQKKIQRKTRKQAEHEFRDKLEKEVAKALEEAEEKHKTEMEKALKEAEEKHKTEMEEALKEAEEQLPHSAKRARERVRITSDEDFF